VAKTYHLGPLRRVVNKLVGSLVRIGIAPRSTYLLITTGRTSGLARATPVRLVEDTTQRWLVAPYGAVGWVRNVRAGSPVFLRRGRRTETLDASEVDPGTAGPVLRQYLRTVRVTAPFFDADRTDPVDRFVEEAARHPVFRLTRPGTATQKATE